MRSVTAAWNSRLGKRSLLVGIIAALAFAILTVLVVAGATSGIDVELIHSVRAEASPPLTSLLLAVTFTSGKLAAPAAIIVAIALYLRSGRRALFLYVLGVISGQAVNALLKYAVHRKRPHGISPHLTAAGGYGFPSADVMMAVLIFVMGAVMLSWSVRSRRSGSVMALLSVIFVAADAVARVYLGAHWPSDVAGAVLAGVAWASVWIAVAAVARDQMPDPLTPLKSS